MQEIAKELKNIPRLSAISVSELVEENHKGKHRNNSIYTRAPASDSADPSHRVAILNTVISHIEGYGKFIGWVSEI